MITPGAVNVRIVRIVKKYKGPGAADVAGGREREVSPGSSGAGSPVHAT